MTEVSNGDLLGVLLKVENRLGGMDGTLTAVKEQLSADRLRATAVEIAQNSKHEKAEIAIQSLQRYRWTQTGAASVLGALFYAIFGHRFHF